jgi:hypothetical protein
MAGLNHRQRLRRAVGDVGQGRRAGAAEDPVGSGDGDVIRQLPGLGSLEAESATIPGEAGAAVDVRDFAGQLRIVRAVPWFVEAVLPVERGLVEIRKQQDPPTVSRPAIVVDEIRRRECSELVMVNVKREADLFEVVFALRPQASFARSGDCRQKEAKQDSTAQQRCDNRIEDLHDGSPEAEQKDEKKKKGAFLH